MNNFGARFDVDVQVLWQLDNLGFGNLARAAGRKAETDQAQFALLRTQDRVAAEVSQALAQAQLAEARAGVSERGLRLAADSLRQNLLGLGQTRGAGDLIQLVIRPQEVVAAVQTLAQAYADYYGAVAEANRAQFRLYRALGKPAHLLAPDGPTAPPCLAQPPADGGR
jgi:outer membrane protein TolC